MDTIPWWRDAVIYQVYPRSWADANGDGVGDLPGITARLDHLCSLGVDALWLSPFYVSPQHDAGYDVADYRDVDPVFGTLDDADKLITRAQELGLRVLIDLVPNHSSSDHQWFGAALTGGPGSKERARYIFRDGRGEKGAEPPNNWQSVFGGPAWTRVTEADGRLGQWYLHLFDVTQPDFDWTNPEVGAEFESVIRFWLDRGVDGFRIDVAHGLVKAEGLPDQVREEHLTDDARPGPEWSMPMWDQPGVHDIYRRWRTIVEDYARSGTDADRILCAEAWVGSYDSLSRYVRPDELHQSFNFAFLQTPWLADKLRETITNSLDAADAVGAPQTWVLSNHDVVRHASRLGYLQEPDAALSGGIGSDDPQPERDLGLRRARAATALMLALPGSAYLYQGEELGLPEATRLPDEVRKDPTWERSGHHSRGRDGCRVPMPWEASTPSLGFGRTDATWLPQPPEYAVLAVDLQEGVPGSTLELYRELLRCRRDLRLGRGTLSWLPDQPAGVVAFRNEMPGRSAVLVLANLGSTPVRLPDGLEPRVSSSPLTPDNNVPTDVTVWADQPT